jgi:hypothetical protein
MADNATTSTIWGQPPLTKEILMEATEKLKAIPKNDKWLVVNPEGQMFTGTAEQLLPLLIQGHPLFKPVFNFKEKIKPIKEN